MKKPLPRSFVNQWCIFIGLFQINWTGRSQACTRQGQAEGGRAGQGILKGELSLFCWPPVWLVWNQLYDNWQFLFLFAKHAIQTGQTGGQWYSDTPFSIPWTGTWIDNDDHSREPTCTAWELNTLKPFYINIWYTHYIKYTFTQAGNLTGRKVGQSRRLW